MAFQERNPNLLGPFFSKDKTWSNPGESQKSRKEVIRESSWAKENVDPTRLGSMLSGFDTASQSHLNKIKHEISMEKDTRNLCPAPPGFHLNRTMTPLSTLSDTHPVFHQARHANETNWNQNSDENVMQLESLVRLQSGGTSEDSKATTTFGKFDLSGSAPQQHQSKDFASVVRSSLHGRSTWIGVPESRQSFAGISMRDATMHASPTLSDYLRRMRDIVDSKSKDAPELVKKVLSTMIDLHSDGSSEVRPDGACYNYAIYAYARSGDALGAESILRTMLRDYESGNTLAEPNVRIYTNILHAWQKSSSQEAPERCELLLEKMNELHVRGVFRDCKPDTFAYTAAIHCWAESKHPQGPERAEALFRKMKMRFQEGDEALRPDSIAYSNLINAFSQGSAYAHTEDILWEMVDDYLSGNEKAKPRVRNFNTVLSVWSKSANMFAPERAQAIVRRLRELNAKRLLEVKPDAYTYSLLLKCWTTSRRPDAADEALKILWWLRGLHEKGEEAARLDIVKYTTVISALARKGNPESAEMLLENMVNDFLRGNSFARPDSKSFDLVLNAWTGWSGNTSCANPTKAETFLRYMWYLFEEKGMHHIRPNAFTYVRVISSFKYSQTPSDAELLLKEMDNLYSSKRLDHPPNERLFMTVINMWKSVSDNVKYQHISSLQQAMEERFGRKESSISRKDSH